MPLIAVGERHDPLVKQPAGGAIVSFLADETTFANAVHPILAVWVLPPSEDRVWALLHPNPFAGDGTVEDMSTT